MRADPAAPNTVWAVIRLSRRITASGASAGAGMPARPAFPPPPLTTTGRKSGEKFIFPLFYGRTGDAFFVVASKGGAPQHPVWYSTLKHLPDVMIQDGDTPRRYSLRELSGAERQQWWDRAVEAYPPYADYQERATERTIPVLLATPVDA